MQTDPDILLALTAGRLWLVVAPATTVLSAYLCGSAICDWAARRTVETGVKKWLASLLIFTSLYLVNLLSPHGRELHPDPSETLLVFGGGGIGLPGYWLLGFAAAFWLAAPLVLAATLLSRLRLNGGWLTAAGFAAWMALLLGWVFAGSVVPLLLGRGGGLGLAVSYMAGVTAVAMVRFQAGKSAVETEL